jgi:hypothetical protein
MTDCAEWIALVVFIPIPKPHITADCQNFPDATVVTVITPRLIIDYTLTEK